MPPNPNIPKSFLQKSYQICHQVVFLVINAAAPINAALPTSDDAISLTPLVAFLTASF